MKTKSLKIILIYMTVFLFSWSSLAEDVPQEQAILAGGCFWCTESPYDDLAGVYAATSGYTGGKIVKPTYQQVASGQTEHIEAVEVKYNPTKISYVEILGVYFSNINPTDSKGQFADRGANYRPAIFYKNEKQKKLAKEFIKELNASRIFSKPIGVEVLPFKVFYDAEDYHQNYHKKNPLRYKLYKFRSGRQPYLDKVWTEENKKILEKIVNGLKK